MRVKTEQLKEMVSKAVKGSGNDNLIPLTQLMGVKKVDNNIMLTTTDGVNYLYVVEEINDDSEDMQVVVYVEQFSKLVSRMTSEYIELNVTDKALEIVGNGTYTMELKLDEDGSFIVYPDPISDLDVSLDNTISLADIKIISETLKPSLATTEERPAIKNYYVADKVMATDRYKIASYDIRLIKDKDTIMSPQLIELLSAMPDNIQYYVDDDMMLFASGDMKIYSKYGDKLDELFSTYPASTLNLLLDEKYTSECTVSKDEFIALLERISLFIGAYDDKAIKLSFEKDGIRVSNKSNNSNELIEYLSSKKFKKYECVITSDMLLSQIKAYNGDTINIHYNNDKAIQFKNKDITQVTSLVVS